VTLLDEGEAGYDPEADSPEAEPDETDAKT